MSEDTLRSGIRRTAWVPLLIGGLCGAVTGVIQAFMVGLPDQALWLAIFDGAAGLVLGAISMAIVLIMSIRVRTHLGIASVLVSMLIAGLTAFWLTRGFLLIPMLATAALTTLAHLITARRSRSLQPEAATITHGVTDSESGTSSPRASRILTLVGGGIVALVLASGAVGTLREGIHYGCSYGTMGEAAGSWMCADGIGYILPGLGLLFGSGLSLLVGMIVVIGDLPKRAVQRVLTTLAFVPLIWSTSFFAIATLGRTDPLPTGETWSAVWLFAVGIATLVALLGTAVASAGALTRRLGGRAVWIVGIALLLAATLIQPGLGLATAATAALLIAAGRDQTHPLTSSPAHRTPSEALAPGID